MRKTGQVWEAKKGKNTSSGWMDRNYDNSKKNKK